MEFFDRLLIKSNIEPEKMFFWFVNKMGTLSYTNKYWAEIFNEFFYQATILEYEWLWLTSGNLHPLSSFYSIRTSVIAIGINGDSSSTHDLIQEEVDVMRLKLFSILGEIIQTTDWYVLYQKSQYPAVCRDTKTLIDVKQFTPEELKVFNFPYEDSEINRKELNWK